MIRFAVYREFPDEDGMWNPVREGPFSGSLQVNLNGSAEEYRRLAAYFLELAECDTSGDTYYHEHLGPFFSIGGEIRVHMICRKDDPRM